MDSRTGSLHGRSGNALERDVVNVLNDEDYLVQYKENRLENSIYNCILDYICTNGLSKNDISSINASNYVEKLASKGNAKTDVVITIIKIDESQIIETLSIKNTTASVVSCHDYKYQDFVRVLNVAGERLETYFRLFQANPSYRAFARSLPEGYSIDDFENELTPYLSIFTKWVLTGEHDTVNLTNPTEQISKSILIVKNGQMLCISFEDYINRLNAESLIRFGLPFRWTYPSKQRGVRIQLKMPILI